MAKTGMARRHELARRMLDERNHRRLNIIYADAKPSLEGK